MIVMPESGPGCAMACGPLDADTVNSVARAGLATALLRAAHRVVTGQGRDYCPRTATPSAGQMDNRSEHGDDGADQRRSAALIGLIIILALAIAGVVLVRELRERSRLEDCLMSGRTNCAPIEVPLRR